VKPSIRTTLFCATALSALAFLPTLASAQTAPAVKPPCPTAPGSAATADCPAVPAARAAETIVVTGSRIRRDTFTSASPITVITNENAVLAGSIDVAEVLQGTTAAAGTTQINNFFTGFVVEGGPGIQTVGLNSLGPTRTLLLINGRRLPPSGTRGQTGAVDLATLPNLALARIEILKEGASPIYGSDAVGGVINAIVRKNVNGFEATIAGSGPFEGGGEDFTVGALWGKTADNWNVMVSGEYFKQSELSYGDRDYCLSDYVFNGVTGALGDFIDPATGQPKCFGLGVSFNRVAPAGVAGTGTGTWVADATQTTRRLGLNPTTGAANTLLAIPGYRRLFSPPPGQIGSPIANQLNYEHPLQQATSIISPSERFNFFATAARDLDILGGVEVYGEALAARRVSSQNRSAQFFFSNLATPLVANYIFNPFTAAGVANIFVQPVIIRPANSEQTVETWQLLGGIRGQTGNGIGGFLRNGNWDAYVQTSDANGEYGGTVIARDRIEATLQTTRSAGGTLSCPNPVFTGGTCLPINFFDPRVIRGDYTAEEYNYLYGLQSVGNTNYKQTVFEANVSGDVFKFPSASDEVKLNVGVQYRKFSINDVPGPTALQQCPVAGCRPLVSTDFNSQGAGINLVTNQFLSSAAQITKGEDSVYEVFTEAAIPLLSKKPLVEDLEVTLAARYTNYDSYDSNSTWKATVNWKVTPELSLIAISGTSYRAPALFELFLGNQTGFLGQTQIDPCVNYGSGTNEIVRTRCAALGIPADYNGAGQSATIFSGGGIGNLKEENSRSDIFSLVYKPTKINLNLRVDWWKISVTDQVQSFGAGNIVGACYGDTNEARAALFCGLLNRDLNPSSPTFRNITTVRDNYVNIASQDVEGIDLRAVYIVDFAFGKLTIDSEHRWTTKNASGLFSDEVLFDAAGDIGDPIYTSNTTVQFDRKDWRFSWAINAIGPATETNAFPTNPVAAAPGSYYSYNGLTSVLYKKKLETTISHTLGVRYKSDDWTLVAAVNNVFNELPPSVSTGVAPFGRLGTFPLASQYDPAGRSLLVSVTRRF
jgi:iron complex outermembrane recepter protein